MLDDCDRVLLEEPSNDRLGDRMRVDLVLAASNLLLNFIEAHGAFPFPYRRLLPDQF